MVNCKNARVIRWWPGGSFPQNGRAGRVNMTLHKDQSEVLLQIRSRLALTSFLHFPSLQTLLSLHFLCFLTMEALAVSYRSMPFSDRISHVLLAGVSTRSSVSVPCQRAFKCLSLAAPSLGIDVLWCFQLCLDSEKLRETLGSEIFEYGWCEEWFKMRSLISLVFVNFCRHPNGALRVLWDRSCAPFGWG